MAKHQSADAAAGVTVHDPLNHPGLRVSPLARHQDESGAVQVRRFSGPGGNHFHVMHQDASGVTTAEHHMDFPGFASWLRSQPAERRHVLLAPLKLARYQNATTHIPQSAREKTFYHFLSQIDPRDSGGTYEYTNAHGDTTAAPGIFADWLRDHDDWRAPLLDNFPKRVGPSSRFWTGQTVEAQDGKRFNTTVALPDTEPFALSSRNVLKDYITVPGPKTYLHDNPWWQLPHQHTSVMDFHVAMPEPHTGVDNGDPRIHIRWTHAMPWSMSPSARAGKSRKQGHVYSAATIHSIMTPEQVEEMANNAPTEVIGNHLRNVVASFRKHVAELKPDWPKRLGRLVSARPFLGDPAGRKVLRDFFEESGDPRADLFTQGDKRPRVEPNWAQRNLHPQGAPDYFRHDFGDGTYLHVTAHPGWPFQKDWEVHLGSANGQIAQAAFTHTEFKNWLRKFPAETVRRIIATTRRPYIYGNRNVRLPRQLARPTAEIGTTQHQKRIEIARRILAEAGVKPAAVRAVIANGDRAGVLQLLQGNVHPALARYLAAWFGLLTGEQAMTVFHPAKNGEDFLHVVSTAYPPDKLAAYLKSAGAPQFSVESTPTGSRAFLYNPLGKYDIDSTLKGLPDASHSRIVGFGSRIGGGTGSGAGSNADARAAYRTIIRDFESSATPADQARPSAGPDLHLARIVDTSHFAEPLHDTYLKHYGHESARRANGESDVFVHDRANRSFYKDPQHQILADYLADHDDPREDIVRGYMQHSKTFGEAWKRAGGTVKQVPFGEEILPRERAYPNPYVPGAWGGPKSITMSDGTALTFRKYSRGGKPPAWIIQWTGPDTLGTHDYTTVMGHQQFKNWLRRFDKDELTRIVKGMRNGR